jgi:hypothetical protein
MAFADVPGPVKVTDQVDEEPKGDVPLLDRPGRVPEQVHEFYQLGHDALVSPVGKPLVVAVLNDRHIHGVPGGSSPDPALVLLGPGRGIGQRRSLIEPGLDRGSRLRVPGHRTGLFRKSMPQPGYRSQPFEP